MNNLKQAAEQALEALEALKTEFRALDLPYGSKAYAKGNEASHALRTALEQRKPLTIAEVEQILVQHNYEIHGDRARYIVRMTEAAHGIKENT